MGALVVFGFSSAILAGFRVVQYFFVVGGSSPIEIVPLGTLIVTSVIITMILVLNRERLQVVV